MALISLICMALLCAVILFGIAALICLLGWYTEKVWLVMIVLIASYVVVHFILSFMFAPFADLAKEIKWHIPF